MFWVRYSCGWASGYRSPAPDGTPENLAIPGFDWVFAFPSLWALFQWFSPRDLTEIARHGFRVTKYEAPDVRISGTSRQCVFNPRTARRL